MKKILSFLLLLVCFSANSQKVNEAYQFQIKPAVSKIKVDGNLDDEAWKSSDVAKDFCLRLPTDTCKATNKTEVRLTYDDDFLYVSAICFKQKGGDVTVESMKRDYTIDRKSVV